MLNWKTANFIEASGPDAPKEVGVWDERYEWWTEGAFVRVIGDVHGVFDAFRAIANNARQNGGKVFCMGDFINRGPRSVDCMRLVIEGVTQGWLGFVPGNHDHRLVLWQRAPHLIDEQKFADESALETTLAEIKGLTDFGIVSDFIDLISGSRVWVRVGNIFFAHSMVSDPSVRPPCLREIKRLAGDIGGMAVCGPMVPRPNPVYVDWLDAMPEYSLTFVGHVPLHRSRPVKITGRNGAAAVFMDTGSGPFMGRDDPLSWIDLRREDIANPREFGKGIPEVNPSSFFDALTPRAA